MSVPSESSRLSSAESYRTLRSTVKFAAGGQAVRSVLVVDLDRDQPSDVAERLAMTFADGGDRVCLIDARPTGNERTGEPGFAELIVGKLEAGSLAAARNAGLARIGPGAGLTADMLAGDGVTSALAGLTQGEAFVVVMCRPLPGNADALALAPRVDATILVVSAGRTRRARAVDARDALERVGAHLLGVVMVEEPKRWFW